MPDNSSTLHEDPATLGEEVIDHHRAIASIMEELEAVDWYDQRVAATEDDSLAQVLAHSRDEEKEHAVMTLEWLRRHDDALDAALRQYLFTSGSIVAIEHEATDEGGGGAPPDGPSSDGSLGIGSLRGKDLL
jgi:ferritin-like protein